MYKPESGAWTKEKKEQIRQVKAIPITRILKHYGLKDKLQRKRNRLVGKSPFWEGEDYSFSVEIEPETGRWFDSCGMPIGPKGFQVPGDTIGLVMALERIEFEDAVARMTDLFIDTAKSVIHEEEVVFERTREQTMTIKKTRVKAEQTLTDTQIEKGKDAERNFRNWLDKHGIPYLFVEQGADSISAALQNLFHSKRPDFIILIPKVGFIVVDVKYAIFKNEVFFISDSDLQKYRNLEANFNLKVWFAASNKERNYSDWHWISPEHASTKGQISARAKGEKNFKGRDISLRDCLKISKTEGLQKYYGELGKY